jgi:hypothetical protein
MSVTCYSVFNLNTRIYLEKDPILSLGIDEILKCTESFVFQMIRDFQRRIEEGLDHWPGKTRGSTLFNRGQGLISNECNQGQPLRSFGT